MWDLLQRQRSVRHLHSGAALLGTSFAVPGRRVSNTERKLLFDFCFCFVFLPRLRRRAAFTVSQRWRPAAAPTDLGGLVCKNIKALHVSIFSCVFFHLSSRVIVNTRKCHGARRSKATSSSFASLSRHARDANTRPCHPLYACTVEGRTAIG